MEDHSLLESGGFLAGEFGDYLTGADRVEGRPGNPGLFRRGRGPISPDSLSSALHYLVRKLELPLVSLKGFRTTFASALSANKTNDKDVADMLGHSGTTTARKHYLMENAANKVRAAKRLDSAVRKLLGEATGGPGKAKPSRTKVRKPANARRA